ncbi:uncharacterized protein LOC133409449 [Phycodurus eques]|uniref:uncharacterized protein LOC133409449 n=1 Tax=Phycodurus eques TaxID=693459 RepID=UPI002ACDF6D0|nr:uncharacterized protein LOC133409449 [Phycodurus eques]XP_061545435.1 uncharacterized protein LOC133409449 [Phycodurus eques]
MEMDDYSIKAEVILPMVQKYFERILPAQWSMLAAGTVDSATQVILADMCTDITQKLCADTIRVIIPEFKQRIQSADKKRMKLKVEGGLSTAFASALSVPEQRSKSSQKLDSLFKREISQRVNHTLSAATSTDSQLVPLIYIPGTFTKIEVLAKMVLLACGALKVYLSKMAIYAKCFRPCWRQKTREEPPCDSKCGNVCIFNREETTEAVMNILRKWTDSEDESLSLRTNRELKKTAAEIVTTIIKDLHYPDPSEEGRSRSSTPHFNLGLIKDQLCEFFESCVSPNSSNESNRKRNFLNFCQKKFDELTFELQKVRCRCMRLEEEMSRCGTQTPDGDNLLSFQGIQPGLEDVFHKVAPPAGAACIDVDKLRHEADKFSLDLADKLYHYMTTNRTTVQSDAVWRRYSEPLILEVDEEKPENIQVLHKIVEDTATKFVQQLLLWLKMEPVTRGNHADEVYGCLNDIDTLIAGTVIPQANEEDLDDTRPKSTSSHIRNAHPPSTQEETVTVETGISQKTETDGAQGKTPPSGVVRVAWPSPLRPPSVQETCLHRDASRSRSPSSHVTSRSSVSMEEMVTSLVAVLVIQLLTRLQKKHKKIVLSRDTLPIIQRLTKKVLQDPRLCVITEANIYSVNKLMKAVIRELLREFNSTHQLLEAFLSDELRFDNTLLKLLMFNMDALKAPQQRRTQKLFAAVRRVFLWTFCIPSSSSKQEILAYTETDSGKSASV